MRFKVFLTARIYHQLFIIVLLLRNSVSGQIDWAEDEDDPGELLITSLKLSTAKKSLRSATGRQIRHPVGITMKFTCN
jgi:hypothetical protein